MFTSLGFCNNRIGVVEYNNIWRSLDGNELEILFNVIKCQSLDYKSLDYESSDYKSSNCNVIPLISRFFTECDGSPKNILLHEWWKQNQVLETKKDFVKHLEYALELHVLIEMVASSMQKRVNLYEYLRKYYNIAEDLDKKAVNNLNTIDHNSSFLDLTVFCFQKGLCFKHYETLFKSLQLLKSLREISINSSNDTLNVFSNDTLNVFSNNVSNIMSLTEWIVIKFMECKM